MSEPLITARGMNLLVMFLAFELALSLVVAIVAFAVVVLLNA